MTESQKLLAEYANTRSEAAFRELVSRYIDLVYSTALRLVGGDAHRAHDVTQAVFTDLSRQSAKLSKDSALGGWLHRNTCFTASNLMRGERRRQLRESHAAEMNALNAPENIFSDIAPVLDEAINELGDEDRKAILMRFYEQRDLRSIGEALGTTQNAAQKRVARALEQLHGLLSRRGVTLSATALAGIMATQAVTAAPAGLSMTVAGAVLAGTTTGGALLFASNLLKMTTLKIAAISALAVAVAAVPVIQQNSLNKLQDENRLLKNSFESKSGNTFVNQSQNHAPQTVTSPPLPAQSPELTQIQQSELLRLRGEVTRLRAENNDLQKLRQENLRLRIRENESSSTNPSPAAAPPFYVRSFKVDSNLLQQKLKDTLEYRTHGVALRQFFKVNGIDISNDGSVFLNPTPEGSEMLVRAPLEALNQIETLLLRPVITDDSTNDNRVSGAN